MAFNFVLVEIRTEIGYYDIDRCKGWNEGGSASNGTGVGFGGSRYPKYTLANCAESYEGVTNT